MGLSGQPTIKLWEILRAFKEDAAISSVISTGTAILFKYRCRHLKMHT